MDDPIRRLRAADPAAALPPQPDAEAEAGLRLLLGEPPAEVRAAPAPPIRGRFAPLVVTGLVGLVVAAVTAAVLTGFPTRTHDAAGPTPGPSAATIAPPYDSSTCDPAVIAPFECGTYRSAYGAPSVSGDTGGPADDPMSISFANERGVLLLTAVTESCFAGVLPVRYDGTRLVPAGEAAFGQYAGCDGPGTNDERTWAHAFLTGDLAIDGGGDLLAFDLGTAMVTFEYQGAAGIGEAQLPRSDRTCVPAHVQPFDCGAYRSVAGTGTLAFLADHPYRLSFRHANGELVAGFGGDCNGFSASLQPRSTPAGTTVFALPGAGSLMGCPAAEGARDDAVTAFFDGELFWKAAGDTITFTSDTATATFRRG